MQHYKGDFLWQERKRMISKEDKNKIIDLGKQLVELYMPILELVPKEHANLLLELTESCLLITSFIAYICDLPEEYYELDKMF